MAGVKHASRCDVVASAFMGEGVEEEDMLSDDDDSTWLRREKARSRQIMIGQARPEYLRYLEEVPKASRTASRPRTPDPRARVSKRCFDRSLGEWRRQLHQYDIVSQQQSSVAGDVGGKRASAAKHGNASVCAMLGAVSSDGRGRTAAAQSATNDCSSQGRHTQRQRAAANCKERNDAVELSSPTPTSDAVVVSPPAKSNETDMALLNGPTDSMVPTQASAVVQIRLADQLLREETAQLLPLPLPQDAIGLSSLVGLTSSAYNPWQWSAFPAGQNSVFTQAPSFQPTLAPTPTSCVETAPTRALISCSTSSVWSAQAGAEPQTPKRSSSASRFAVGTFSDSDTAVFSNEKLRGKVSDDVADNELSVRYPAPPPLPMSPGAPLTPKPPRTPKPHTDDLGRFPPTPHTNWPLRTPSPERLYWNGKMSLPPWATSHTSAQVTEERRREGELWIDAPEFWGTAMPCSLPFSDAVDDCSK
eukprot:TRINITY_DN665_c0_g1_i2.p1 TRINITY_DN665_c0_g1~~TRINITY_DN665_c0_g1_i2.p1  ORF type:complete len:493 (-),score=65.55 TRINITY_DN665_c0_g1_i2:373-1797(-)